MLAGDVRSLSDECVGTATPSTQTSIHGAISGTPSLQQLLEERTPSTQTVVTRVKFHESFYALVETTMPMFGSTSGGKSGVASALVNDDAMALKEARPKEDVDRGAACPNMHNDESMSREMSPQQSLSDLHTREHFALLFRVGVVTTVEDGTGSHILPAYAWTEHIIGDILSPTIEDISHIVLLNPMEYLIFQGHCSKGEGFSYSEAFTLSHAYHREATTWIGCRVKMHCVMHTL